MKIAYIDPHPVPDDLPETMQILQTVDAMGKLGSQVLLVTPYSDKSAELVLDRPLSTNVQTVYLRNLRNQWWYPKNSNKGFYWQVAYWVFRNQSGFDVILVRNLKLAEFLLKRFPKLAVFFETHELFAKVFEEENSPLTRKNRRKLNTLKKREYFVYKNSKGIIALTPFLVEDIKSYYALEQAFVVAPDGVDLALANKALSQPSVQNDVPIILYLGSLHPWKGVELIIRAMPNIEKGILWIAGGEQKRIDELWQLSTELGIVNRVSFLGRVAPNERFNIIHKTDICVLPLSDTSIATRYTSPLKLFEYLAMGKVVVVPAIDSISSIITNKVNAMTFFLDSIDSLSSVLNTITDGKMIGKKNLMNSAKNLSLSFSWEKRANTILGFLLQNKKGNI
jgi:glycosyltransferase involved in cell wall biosynthesis